MIERMMEKSNKVLF